jgi:hypothetical protein
MKAATAVHVGPMVAEAWAIFLLFLFCLERPFILQLAATVYD